MANNISHSLRLVSLLVRRDLKVKYRGTALGYIWSMLNPLLFMLILWSVFRHIVKDIPNYHLYVLSGILVWNFISMSLFQGAQSIVGNAGLLRKVKVNAWLFTLVPVGTGLTNFCLALIPFLFILAFSGVYPGWPILLVPLLMVALSFFLFGLALILGSLNVFFRDVGHVLEPVLTIAFYATPVIFDRASAALPAKLAFVLKLNPFTHFIEAFRACFIGHGDISWEKITGLLAMSIMSMCIGILVHLKTEKNMIFHL